MELPLTQAPPPGHNTAMTVTPSISLIVPTKSRPQQLKRLLTSLAETIACCDSVETILVMDSDDRETMGVGERRLNLRYVAVPPGLTMGSLNMAGYEAACGRYLMLLNDDVIARTPGWDEQVRACFAVYPDEQVLVHVNDLVMQWHLCTFPIVSRAYCEIARGICPRSYQRYRIDDHIEDCFNLLGVLGERRIIFAPQIVFEHQNYVENSAGLRQYFSDPAMLALDAPRFDMLQSQRKEIALRMKARIAGRTSMSPRWRRRLARVADPFALRVPGRQRILTEQGIVDPWDLEPSLSERVRTCVRQNGLRGLVRAAWRRMARGLCRSNSVAKPQAGRA
jgi:hypothetical protein